MSNPWVSILLAVALAALCLPGGGALMEALCHRKRAEELRRNLPHEADRKPLFLRWKGYDPAAVDRNWAPLHQGDAGKERQRAEARAAERRFYELDLVYPFLYGGGLAAGLLLCWAAVGRPFHPAWLLAPVLLTMLADWIENSVVLGQWAAYSANPGVASLSASAVRLASCATQVKIALLVVSGLAWAGMLVWAAVCALRRGP